MPEPFSHNIGTDLRGEKLRSMPVSQVVLPDRRKSDRHRVPRLAVKAGATPIAYRFNRAGIVIRDTLALHDAIVGREISVQRSPDLRAHALNARNKPTASGT